MDYNGSEGFVDIPLRKMHYYDMTTGPRKFYGKNIDLDRLANDISQYLMNSGFKTEVFRDSIPGEARLHIQAIKSGKWRTVAAMRQKADIIIMGVPHDFIIRIPTGESFFEAADRMQSFVRGGFEKSIWNYIQTRINNLMSGTV